VLDANVGGKKKLVTQKEGTLSGWERTFRQRKLIASFLKTKATCRTIWGGEMGGTIPFKHTVWRDSYWVQKEASKRGSSPNQDQPWGPTETHKRVWRGKKVANWEEEVSGNSVGLFGVER